MDKMLGFCKVGVQKVKYWFLLNGGLSYITATEGEVQKSWMTWLRLGTLSLKLNNKCSTFPPVSCFLFWETPCGTPEGIIKISVIRATSMP